jgi:putative spermidine/putrescine transport system permease protein
MAEAAAVARPDTPPPVLVPRRRIRLVALLLLMPSLVLMGYIFLAPMAIFLQYSFYRFQKGRLEEAFTFEAYERFLFEPYFHATIADTFFLAVMVTVFSLLIGYPLAFALWRLNGRWLQKWLALIIFSPILVSEVVRSYGWTVLLAERGPVNWALMGLGLVDEPVRLIFNLTGVVISLTHIFLPFTVFPIFATMTRLDPSLREAAMDLGAGWWTTFRRVTFPLTLPGIVAAAQISFTLTLGAFVTPSILGGGRVLVLPLQIYRATAEINWPVAAVGGLVLLLMAFIAVVIFNRLLKFSEV